MNTKQLIELGLTQEQADKVFALHGTDIEKFKAAAEASKVSTDALQAQLTEAGTTIEGFKKLDPAAIQKTADDWKATAEKAQADAAKQISGLKFDHALEGALTGAKARNAKAVKALLNSADLKLSEDGSIVGLKDQLDKIKSENDYLFESDTQVPRIVVGGQNKSVIGADDSVLRKAAGLLPK